MSTETKKNAFLDALDQRVIVFDGAMGTSLQAMNLTAEHFGSEKLVGCNDALVLNSPQTKRRLSSPAGWPMNTAVLKSRALWPGRWAPQAS